MNNDRCLNIVIVMLLVLGVAFLAVSIFGDNQSDHHPLPIALSCVFSANMLVVARNMMRKRRDK